MVPGVGGGIVDIRGDIVDDPPGVGGGGGSVDIRGENVPCCCCCCCCDGVVDGSDDVEVDGGIFDWVPCGDDVVVVVVVDDVVDDAVESFLPKRPPNFDGFRSTDDVDDEENRLVGVVDNI